MDQIHELTKTGQYGLQIILKKNGVTKEVNWSTFSISDAGSKYRLTVNGFNPGTSGLRDALAYHNGVRFSTPESDNDEWSRNCAAELSSGWWFHSCIDCNLNSGSSNGPEYQGSNDEAKMVLKR